LLAAEVWKDLQVVTAVGAMLVVIIQAESVVLPAQ